MNIHLARLSGLAVAATAIAFGFATGARAQAVEKLTIVIFSPPSLGALLPPVIKAQQFDIANGLDITFEERTPDAYVTPLNPGAPKAVARQFNRIAWPAFGVLLLTGGWNLVEVKVGDASTKYQFTLFAQLCIVALSGLTTVLHPQPRPHTGLAPCAATSADDLLCAPQTAYACS